MSSNAMHVGGTFGRDPLESGCVDAVQYMHLVALLREFFSQILDVNGVTAYVVGRVEGRRKKESQGFHWFLVESDLIDPLRLWTLACMT
jgi:hypothetical protein